MKVSVVGTRKWEKRLRIIVQEKQRSVSWRKQHIANVTGYRGINFLNDYDEADEEKRRWLLQEAKWNNENPSAEKIKANKQLRLHSPIDGSVGKKQIPSFSFSFSFLGFKSQKFLHEFNCDGVSGADNDQQSLNNSASVFHLWLLEAFSRFQNGASIILVNAELS